MQSDREPKKFHLSDFKDSEAFLGQVKSEEFSKLSSVVLTAGPHCSARAICEAAQYLLSHHQNVPIQAFQGGRAVFAHTANSQLNSIYSTNMCIAKAAAALMTEIGKIDKESGKRKPLDAATRDGIMRIISNLNSQLEEVEKLEQDTREKISRVFKPTDKLAMEHATKCLNDLLAIKNEILPAISKQINAMVAAPELKRSPS